MKSNQLIKQRINDLLLCIEALDPYILDNLISKLYKLDGIDPVGNRAIKLGKQQYAQSHSKPLNTLATIHMIHQALAENQIQDTVTKLIREIIHVHKNNERGQDFSLLRNFARRFANSYKRSQRPYLVGHSNYKSNEYMFNTSIMALFTLHKMCSSENSNALFNYLIFQ